MVFFSWLQLSNKPKILVDNLSNINNFDKLIFQNLSNCKLRHFGYKLFFVNILGLITWVRKEGSLHRSFSRWGKSLHFFLIDIFCHNFCGLFNLFSRECAFWGPVHRLIKKSMIFRVKGRQSRTFQGSWIQSGHVELKHDVEVCVAPACVHRGREGETECCWNVGSCSRKDAVYNRTRWIPCTSCVILCFLIGNREKWGAAHYAQWKWVVLITS